MPINFAISRFFLWGRPFIESEITFEASVLALFYFVSFVSI